MDKIKTANKLFDYINVLIRFVWLYKKFFLSLLVFLLICVMIVVFVREVGQSSKKYEVTIENADKDVTLSAEDIIYEREHKNVTHEDSVSNTAVIASSTKQSYKLHLVNSSDVTGLAASLRSELEGLGYVVDSISSDFEEVRPKTVIIYSRGLEEEVLEIGKLLKALPSSSDKLDENEVIIYIGNDFTSR